MTRYQKMWETEDVTRAMNRYHTDKAELDADSARFQAIDDMDMGERFLVSYDMPVIMPISEILWIRFLEFFGKKHMWTLVSDGYVQFLLVEDESNIETIVEMLRARNHKLIYGENDDLKALLDHNFEKVRELIELHPNEDAATIQVDPAWLPAPEPEVPEADPPVEKEPEISFIPPAEQDLDAVTVPEDLPFAEEIKLIIHLAKTHPDDVSLTLYEPASASDIDAFEQRNNIRLSDELRMLFLFSNGFDFSAGSIGINPLSLIESYLSVEWEWGDTENYVYIGDMIGCGEVILMDRDSGRIITNDHGEETDYGDLTTLLSDGICLFLKGEVDDEKLDAYIRETEGSE